MNLSLKIDYKMKIYFFISIAYAAVITTPEACLAKPYGPGYKYCLSTTST